MLYMCVYLYYFLFNSAFNNFSYPIIEVMSDYKKAGSKKIEGKKTKVVVYKKSGSSKLYVKRKGRMMNFVNYKKMCAKKLAAKKVSKVRKVRKGGNSCSQQQNGGNEDMEGAFNEEDTGRLLEGGKKKQKNSRTQQRQKFRNLRNLLSQRGGDESILSNMADDKEAFQEVTPDQYYTDGGARQRQKRKLTQRRSSRKSRQ